MKDLVIVVGSRRAGVCRSCGAAIEWATIAASQKAMPFDRPIVLALDFLEEPPPGQAVVDMTRTVSHFATCPQAASWRRAR